MLTLKLEDIISEGNVRVETGDVSTLAASINRFGLLQPPLVRDTDEEGIYSIVAGHRRVAALRELGYTKVECNYADDVDLSTDLIAAQWAENTERKGLTDWEQAQVAWDLKLEGFDQGEVSVTMGIPKKEVSQLQKMVRELSKDENLDNMQANRFSFDGLADIAKSPVADHASDVMTKVLEDGVRIWSALNDVEGEIATVSFYEENAEQLNDWSEAGIQISHDNPRHHWGKKETWGQDKDDPKVTSLETLGITVAKHIKEPCHMVWIKSMHGKPSFVHMCMDRKLHKDNGKSDVKAKDQDAAGAAGKDPKAAAERKREREAKDLRRKQAAIWMKKLPNKALLLDLALPLALSGRGWAEDHTRAATWMLGLNSERPKGADYDWYNRALKTYLTDKFEDPESEKALAWKIKMMHARKYIDDFYPNEYITNTLSQIEVSE